MEIKYTFWKDNLTDKIFSLTPHQVKDKFLTWMKSKDKSWLEYYGFTPSMMHVFIGDSEEKKGLQSVSDERVDNHLWDNLKLVRNEYFKSLNIN